MFILSRRRRERKEVGEYIRQAKIPPESFSFPPESLRAFDTHLLARPMAGPLLAVNESEKLTFFY